LKTSAERPDHTPVQYVDYRFPYFADGVYDRRNANFYEELLTTAEFHYEFNKEKREVKLHNRAEILLQVRDLLIKKVLKKRRLTDIPKNSTPKVYLKSHVTFRQSSSFLMTL
jgi:hypothetical protein